ncbi:MAG: hypothetical protein KF784_13375 [Fimbriimonadaceae bacterium]|nr:hypothetical protein [Fimbriimonadaceae bacterium]
MEFFELILGRSEERPAFVPDIVARLPFAVAQTSEKRIYDFYWLQSQTLVHAALDQVKRGEPTNSPLVTTLAPALAELLQVSPADIEAKKGPEPSPLAKGLSQDLHDMALEVVALGKLLNMAMKGRLTHLGAERSEAKRADQAVREGLRETSSERRELFKEAAELYTQVTATSKGDSDAISWMLLGWLKWRLDYQLNESAELWTKALAERGVTKDPITTLISRLSAYASSELDNPHEAFMKLLKLGGECSTPFSLAEAATYAWKAGLPGESKQMLLAAVSRQPLLIVWLAGQDTAEQVRWAA